MERFSSSHTSLVFFQYTPAVGWSLVLESNTSAGIQWRVHVFFQTEDVAQCFFRTLQFKLGSAALWLLAFTGEKGCLLGGVYVRCTHRMPGGVIVGDSGLCCCCGPAFNVMCDVDCSSAVTSHCLLIFPGKASLIFPCIALGMGPENYLFNHYICYGMIPCTILYNLWVDSAAYMSVFSDWLTDWSIVWDWRREGGADSMTYPCFSFSIHQLWDDDPLRQFKRSLKTHLFHLP